MPDTPELELVPPFAFTLEEKHGTLTGYVLEGGVRRPETFPLPSYPVRSVAFSRLLRNLEKKFPKRSFWIDGRTLHTLAVHGGQLKSRLAELFVWNDEEADEAADLTTEEVLKASALLQGKHRSRGSKPAQRVPKSKQTSRPTREIDLDSPGLRFNEDVDSSGSQPDDGVVVPIRAAKSANK